MRLSETSGSRLKISIFQGIFASIDVSNIPWLPSIKVSGNHPDRAGGTPLWTAPSTGVRQNNRNNPFFHFSLDSP